MLRGAETCNLFYFPMTITLHVFMSIHEDIHLSDGERCHSFFVIHVQGCNCCVMQRHLADRKFLSEIIFIQIALIVLFCSGVCLGVDALLAVSYMEAFQITRDPFFSNIAERIFEYISNDMTNEEGGIYCAEDADSLPEHTSKHKVRVKSTGPV